MDSRSISARTLSLLSKKACHLSPWMSPISFPRGVSLMSALSLRSSSLCSDRLVSTR